VLRRRSVSWLFSLHMNESEHPMKSIAVKELPSSRFFEQQDARMFSRRQLWILTGAPSTVCIFLLNSEKLPYSPALVPGEEGGGANVKRQSQTSGP